MIHSGYYKLLFSSHDVIFLFVPGVVVPSIALHTHDIEQFKDDPLEFIHLNLALPSGRGIGGAGRGIGDVSKASTQQQAAVAVLQALIGSGYWTEMMEIMGTWIQMGLEAYSRDANGNWMAKDSACSQSIPKQMLSKFF